MHRSAARIAAFLLLCVSLGPAALAGIEHVKFDLGDLNARDKEDIIQQANDLGTIEAQFEYCGFKTEIVRRVSRAVERCVTLESMKQVISIFHRSKSDMQNVLQVEPVDCSDERRRNWYRTTKAAIDKYIENITRMCRNCIIC
jgi:hypothetical protein